MAQQNPWSGVDMSDPTTQKLASIGTHALVSGKMDPDKAQKMAEAMGIIKKGQKPSGPPDPALLAMGNTGKPKTQLDMGAAPNPQALPGQPSPASVGQDSPQAAQVAAQEPVEEDPSSVGVLPNEKPNAYYKRQLIASQQDTQTDKKNKLLDPNDVKGAMNLVRMSPEYQGLQGGEDRMEQMLSMAAGQKSADPGWVKPLLALADSQTGSHLMQGYNQGPTQDERTKELLKYSNEMQQRKMDMVKALTQGLSAQKGGGAIINVSSQGTKDEGIQGQGSPTGGGLSAQRRNALIAKSGADFDKDSMLTQFAKTNTALDRAQSMMSAHTPITAYDLQMLQQDLNTAFAPGGVVTEGKVQRDNIVPFASIVNSLVARGDSIQDLRKDDPNLFKQLQSRLSLVKNDYNKAGDARVNELATNWKDVPDDLIQSTVQRKSDMLHQKFNPPAPAAPAPRASGHGAAKTKSALPSISDIDAELARRKGSE